jgi:sugar phosphate isomerase/epimerase
LRLRGGWVERAVCRILTGQRYPEVSWEQGREWVLSAFHELIPLAREHDVVLGLENHYKDGFWKYPEFAQAMDRFVWIVNAVEERTYFGVQYDPSNAIVAGDDPIELLRAVAPRVVSMHASDRYWEDGTLTHGVTGQGLNDYPAIFRILAEQKYSGWISIEDGMNGMEDMAQSLKFLRTMTAKYFGE